jgi:mannan endo-1,4-beta-mannosidase
MKQKLLLLVIISMLSFEACSVIGVKENPNYVKVSGIQFVLDGAPYYFVGTNLWYGAYLGQPNNLGDRDRLVNELDKLVSLGISNLRICAASEQSEMDRAIKPAFQKAPGVYDENLLEGLDFLLAEMNKRNMKAVLFLNNYWQWTGGMAQYNQWFTNIKIPDPDNPNIGYGKFMDFSAEFYLNSKARDCYKDYIKMIVTRKNKFTGLFYFEDPAIMTWQLGNEPRPGRDLSVIKSADVFYQWVDETGQIIHSLDPNHLVTIGSEGLAGSLQDEEIFMKAHSSKYIDYSTMHLWPKNWGWLNASKLDETYPRTEKNAVEYINKHIGLARKLNKPITMEEFGIPRDNELCKAGTPTTARDKYYKMVFQIVADSASTGSPLAGTNFWGWGGAGRGQNDNDTWKVGDPYVGDPPQEPQGLNSIFDSDISTLEIIKTHSDQLLNLKYKQIPTNKN